MSYKTINFFNYKLFIDNLNSIKLDKRLIINTINPHSYQLANNDKNFKNALIDANILLPDGVGVTKAVFLLTGKWINKIAGMDVHNYLLKKANKKKLKCFYLGSNNKTLSLIKNRIAKEFNNVIIETYSPPYKDKFSKTDNEIIYNKVNNFCPDVIFVGMTAPKQEKWVFNNKDKINAKVICSIGAVFDFYAGTIKRPGKFWIKIGMEGIVRLLKEPKRLWKRFFLSDIPFMFFIFKESFLNIFTKKYVKN